VLKQNNIGLLIIELKRVLPINERIVADVIGFKPTFQNINDSSTKQLIES